MLFIKQQILFLCGAVVFVGRWAGVQGWECSRHNSQYKGSKARACGQYFKTLILKTKIMSSGPFTSWQIDGETIVTGEMVMGNGSVQFSSVAQSCLTL